MEEPKGGQLPKERSDNYANIMTDTGTILLSWCGSLIIALTGVVISHYLSIRRERDAGRRDRLRAFGEFLNHWHAGLKRAFDIEVFIECYKENVVGFNGEVASVRGEFSGEPRKTFDSLSAAVSRYTTAQVYGEDEEYKKFMSDLEALIQFLNTYEPCKPFR